MYLVRTELTNISNISKSNQNMNKKLREKISLILMKFTVDYFLNSIKGDL